MFEFYDYGDMGMLQERKLFFRKEKGFRGIKMHALRGELFQTFFS